jgi:hypothetical protein
MEFPRGAGGDAELLPFFRMRTVISISETVAPFVSANGRCEVWASAEGKYDDANARLELNLDSFLRRRDEQDLATNWLPGAQTVTSMAPREEATSIAKAIFKHWVSRVRRAVPGNGCSKPS